MKNTMKGVLLVIAVIMIAAMPGALAEDAPSMWMVQTGEDVDIYVNTSSNVSGVSVCVHHNPNEIDITNMSFEGSPWQPLTGTGWSHHSSYSSLAVTNFNGVPPGEYKIATMEIACPEEGTFPIWLMYADLGPSGVTMYDLNYTNSITPDETAVISIGDGVGTDTVAISVTGADNAGAVDVMLTYDPAVVIVAGASGGDMDCTYTNLEHADEGWIRVGAIQGDNPGLTGEFTLLNVELSPMVPDSTCVLALNVTTFKDATPNCTAMAYTVTDGTYQSSKNGDANGDGTVDIADAMYIAKYVVGIEGYETIDEGAADVNGDGIVDMSDSMYLTKHVLGVAGFETLR